MKRFHAHAHAHVKDIAKRIASCSKRLGAEPTGVESDCAKWMREDRRIDFAISTRGSHAKALPT